MRYLRKILPISIIIVFVVSSVHPSPARAASTFSSTPESGWPTFDGPVRAIVPASDGSVYVGGGFTQAYNGANASLPTHFGSFNATTGAVALAGGGGLRGQNILAAISDGATGWYVGGTFTTIAGQSRSRIAHILSDGSVDPSFAPSVDGESTVYALALSPDKSKVYIGGTFTQINGVSRQNGAAVNTSNGSLADFDPGLDASVKAIAVSADGLTVYLGGAFTTVNYAAEGALALAAFDASTGALSNLSFDAGIEADTEVQTLLLDGSTLYAGGTFTSVNNNTSPVDRTEFAELDATTGEVLGPDAGLSLSTGTSSVSTIAKYGSTLYLGGTFDTVNESVTPNCNNIVAIDSGTGIATPFNPDVNEQVVTIAVSPDGETVYAGGIFTVVNQSGDQVARGYAAAFASDTGVATSYNPNLDAAVYSMVVATDGSRVFMGGVFENGLGSLRDFSGIVHIKADKTLDESFNPYITAGSSVYALALSSDGSVLYAGGNFTSVNDGDSTRNKIAAFTTSNGAATLFNPNVGGLTTVYALALSPNDGILYAGGDFTTVNGATTRNKLAAFDTEDSSATPFDPNFNTLDRIFSLALTSDGNTLYAGGDITSLKGGASRKDIAALDTAGEGTLKDFNAHIQSPPESVYALALSPDDSTVYAGGIYSLDGSNPNVNSSLAAFDGITGDVVNDFNPTIDESAPAYTLALTNDGSELYVGGNLFSFDTTDRDYVGNFALSDGSLEDFNQNSAVTGFDDIVRVMTVSSSGTKLYAGGDFTGNLAVFGLSDTTAPTITILGDNPHTLYINTSYSDAGATATDTVDGNLTASIVTTGSVNTLVAGTYTITYTVTDAANNTATATRTVVVAPNPPSGGGSFSPITRSTSTPSSTPTPTPSPTPATPAQYGLKEGDTISSPNSSDPDVYIVNEFGYKRLFLNPRIFSFYGHLHFATVKLVPPQTRNAFITSGLFRNCEANDPKVYGFVSTGEDTGELRWIDTSGTQAVHDDPAFFQKVFCINNKEFTWYPRSATPFTSVTQVPVYGR